MSERLTSIMFGRWFVLFFFGAQGYWQVTGLLSNRSTGRVIETLCWIALSVLLIFIAWKVGWRKLRALGTKTQRRRRRLVVLRSEEHTSELQSQFHLVCRLLLEK